MTVAKPDAGRHNADLATAAERYRRGGSYKRQRTIMVLPAIAPIHPRVYLSHRSLIAPPNQGFLPILAYGDEVGVAYSNTVAGILADPNLREWEYLLTIESDNLPPQDGLLNLLARMEEHPELAAIGGLYWTKGEGGCPQIWGDPRDPVPNYRPQPPVPGQLVECCGLGMGFTLHRLAMFKDERLRKPWFRTLAGKEGVGTQDLTFWGDARKYGFRCAVDCGVLVGHYDERADVVW